MREELSGGVQDMMQELDPISTRIATTSTGVNKNEIGRDWKVIHMFMTSLGGAFSWSTAAGSNVLAAPTTSVVYDTLRTFPSATDSAVPGSVQRTLTLVQGAGNFIVPLHVLQADQLTAMQTTYVTRLIQAVAKMVANTKLVNFYSGDSFNSIAAVSSVTSGGGTGVATVTAVINSGRIRSFFEGVPVDIYDATGVTKRNTVTARVNVVDPISRTVIIKTDAGTNWDSQIVATDIIVPKDCLSLGPSGLEDWIVSSGTLYGMAVATYPRLKSLIAGSIGSLDESVLNKYIGSFDDAYGTMYGLDTIITTGGVTREYLNQSGSFMNYQRQGATLNLQGGWADVGFTYNGKKFDWLISANCLPGTMYVTKTGNGNIKRYVPPAIRGVTSSGSYRDFPQDIQFFGPMTGANSIFMASTNTDGAVNQALQAPFFCFEELAPDQPQSIKLTGLTEEVV
jgi:hypothetical protein